MDLLSLVRPVLHVLKMGNVSLNFGLKESRLLQITLTKVFELIEANADDFLKVFSARPYFAIVTLLNDLNFKDWNEAEDRPGDLTLELLDLLTNIFKSEEPLRELQWFDLLDKISEFEKEVNRKTSENFTTTASTEPSSTKS